MDSLQMMPTESISTMQNAGFLCLPAIFAPAAIRMIGDCIDAFAQAQPATEKSTELHAIRRVLEEIPALKPLLFTPNLLEIIQIFAPANSFLTKSIYFDKPPGSNWFVAWHQDISITVAARNDTPGYSQWTQKQGIVGVVPPPDILQNTLTLRIHLDDTDGSNGALRVVAGSHHAGIIRKEAQPWDPAREHTCDVPAGGVMLMRPLTMHASRRANAGARRRVIHLEFCNQELENGLQWGEKMLR
jgi:Phytanoyl-CoA dioxygenase (PhyH)